MKRFLITLFTLSLCGLVSSQAMSPDGCRDFPPKTRGSMSPAQQVEADLLQGVWTVQETDKIRQFLHFEAAGHATRQEVLPNSQHFGNDDLRWQVEIVNHEPVLTLVESGSGKRSSYFVDQTCDGLVLTDTENGQRTTLAFGKPDLTRKKELQSQLAGQWVNTQADLLLYPACNDGKALRIAHAEVRYAFQNDGSFQKSITSRSDSSQRFEENGRWEISEDGKHLILHHENEAGERVSMFARIKHLELDEMVLTKPAASMGEYAVADLDADLFFNKN